jgi:hypothetical protein
LANTETELIDIAAPANIGLKKKPKLGTRTLSYEFVPTHFFWIHLSATEEQCGVFGRWQNLFRRKLIQ